MNLLTAFAFAIFVPPLVTATPFTKEQISEFHAGCDVCMNVKVLPSRPSHSFTYEFNDISHGKPNVYDYVFGQNAFEPRTHYLYSPDQTAVTCSGVTSYIYDATDTATPMWTSSWEQVQADTCKFNFDYQLTNTNLTQPLVFVTEIEDFVLEDARIDLLRTAETLPKPETGLYSIVSEITLNHDAGVHGHLGFGIDVSRGYDATCQLPPALELSFVNCAQPNIVGTTSDNAAWEFDVPVAYYATCAHNQRVENGMIIFDIEIDPVATMPAADCPSLTDQDDFTAKIFLEVQLSEDIYVDKTSETTFTPLNVDITSYSVDNTDDVSCNGKLKPLAKLDLHIRASINDELWSDMVLVTKQVGHVEFDIVGGAPNCNLWDAVEEMAYCDWHLKTADCLTMEFVENGECRFDHLENLNLEFQATLKELDGDSNPIQGNTVDKKINIFEAKLDTGRVYVSDQCPVIDDAVDATDAFEPVIDVTDEQQNVKLAPDDNVIVHVELPELATINTPLHLIITMVTVQLDGGEEFVFDVEDKVRQMELNLDGNVPLFAVDGHYCSYYSQGSSIECPAFYNNVAAIDQPNDNGNRRWNDWATSELGTSITDNSGNNNKQYIYDLCDGLGIFEDKFIFTPNIWGMIPEGFTTGDLKVAAYGKLRLCSGVSYSGGEIPARRLGEMNWEERELLGLHEAEKLEGNYVKFEFNKAISSEPQDATDAPTMPQVPIMPEKEFHFDCIQFNATTTEVLMSGRLWPVWTLFGLFDVLTLYVVVTSMMHWFDKLGALSEGYGKVNEGGDSTKVAPVEASISTINTNEYRAKRNQQTARKRVRQVKQYDNLNFDLKL